MNSAWHLMQLTEQSGLRAFIGKVNMDRNSPDYLCEDIDTSLEETEELIVKSKEELKHVRYILTPRFVLSSIQWKRIPLQETNETKEKLRCKFTKDSQFNFHYPSEIPPGQSKNRKSMTSAVFEAITLYTDIKLAPSPTVFYLKSEKSQKSDLEKFFFRCLIQNFTQYSQHALPIDRYSIFIFRCLWHQ